jgi:hypothetical protein
MQYVNRKRNKMRIRRLKIAVMIDGVEAVRNCQVRPGQAALEHRALAKVPIMRRVLTLSRDERRWGDTFGWPSWLCKRMPAFLFKPMNDHQRGDGSIRESVRFNLVGLL